MRLRSSRRDPGPLEFRFVTLCTVVFGGLTFRPLPAVVVVPKPAVHQETRAVPGTVLRNVLAPTDPIGSSNRANTVANLKSHRTFILILTARTSSCQLTH